MAMNNVLAFIGGLGTSEVMVIMLVILLLFGAKRIPELAKGLGKGIREFKDATKEIKNEVENAVKDDTHPTSK
ncbi:Sec-independent protein translocase subunit TatA/TatB [Adhaeribacter pallidiroseus]|uniref:Sec-independent protein translocase protein TatA n=1 Tax=Adhaeribacter pallidiroseus TaxID=2072847 RepID=A0A369QIV9_9BACT|nr:twin-arginine translocase TatA/TatE family subunit [Adhaeribacter pallidiroseus]RDC64654.1 Sec-independent protein translocase protein TatA [Adhaeribacter pallidiroseus]